MGAAKADNVKRHKRNVNLFFIAAYFVVNLSGLVENIVKHPLSMPTNRNKELLSVAESIAHFGTFEYDINTGQLICSEGIYFIFGWPVGQPIPTLAIIKSQIQKDDLDSIQTLIIELLKTKREANIECKIEDVDKKTHYINCYVSLKNNISTNSPILLGVIQDITNSKIKELEILQTKNKLNKILESSLDIICAVNEMGIYESVSAACYTILGYKPEEMIGKHFSEFVFKEDFHTTQVARNYIMGGNSMTNFENKLVRKDGEVVNIIWSAYWDTEDKIMYCVARDGTEIKKQASLLLKNEKRFHALVDNASDAIIILNKEGESIYASPSIFKLTGYTQESILKAKMVDLIHPKDIPSLLKYYQVALEKPGDVITADNIRFQHNNNYWIIIEFTLTNLLDDPNIEGIVINFRDVTERENAIRELKLMESVIKNTSDAILITEAEPCNLPGPKIIFVNEAFTEMTGYRKEEVIGKTPRILQGPKTSKTELAKLGNALKNWQRFETTIVNYKKDGEEFWNNFTVTPVADEKGWFTHWIAVERNVTEAKKEELEKILLSDISNLFLQEAALESILTQTIKRIIATEEFIIGEIWLLSAGNETLSLTAFAGINDKYTGFYQDNYHFKYINQNMGLPGHVWKNKKIVYWDDLSNHPEFSCKPLAEKYKIKAMYGIPLINGNQVIGVMCLGISNQHNLKYISTNLFQQVSKVLSAEIIRKRLTIELNKIFTTSGDLIVIADVEGNIKKTNPSIQNILEYYPEEVIDLPFTHFIHPDDEERTRKEADKLSRGETIHYLENRLITKTGTIKWIAWTLVPSSEDNLVYGIGKDITEKKSLEDILNKSNRLARIGSWEINLQNGTVYWSDITKEIREAEPDFIPTFEKGISKFKQGFHRNMIQQRVQECIEKGTPWDEELLIETFKGNWKWVRSIGEGEFLNGKCIRVYGSFQDINDKKLAQQKIFESNERFSMVAKATNDLIWDWDIISGETIRLGTSFFENLGYKSNFSKSNKSVWLDLIHPDDLERVEENRNIIFNDPKINYWEDQYRCKRADGSFAIVYDRGYIVRTSSGKAIKMIGSTQDISKLKQNEIELGKLNEQLMNQAKDLATSNKELENFAYIASHDLQEPLRMISSFLSQIEKKYGHILDEKGKKYIFFAVDGAKRMRQIILDILEFSRIGRQELSKEEVNVKLVIDEIIQLYRKQIEEKNAIIEIGPMPVINTYKSSLRQIFQNLISNALKYQKSDSNAKITIECKKENDYWKFSIKDNGIGIDEEYHDKIFEIFQRLHNKEDYSGTGIGLAIVKKIIENQGGKIFVESEKEKGSIFHFTLPINLTN